MNWKKKLKPLSVVIIIASIFWASMNSLSVIGVPSNYQGPNMFFYGVKITSPNGEEYWKYIGDTGFVGVKSPYHPSDCEFNGHMTTIFLRPDKDPSILYQTAQKIQNAISKSSNSNLQIPAEAVAPENTYVLRMQNNSNEKVVMYEFPAEAFIWFYATAGGYNEQNNYDVWIEINLNDLYQNWYWEINGTPASQVYFAIGKIQATVETSEHYSAYNVNPATNQPLMMYFNLNGTPVNSQQFEQSMVNAFEYQGGRLNPAMFRTHVWIHVELDHFGTHFANFWHTAWRGDAVVIILHFHIFAFGVWKVQDIQNIAPPKPREPTGGFAFSWAIGNWWHSLTLGQKALLTALVSFGALLVIGLVFPEFGMLALFGAEELLDRRKGGGKRCL